MMKTTMLMLVPGAAASLFESRGGLSSEWAVGARAPASEFLTVHAMLSHAPGDVAALERKLYDVSDPKSANYGKHLTLSEISKIAPIHDKQLQLIKGFFQEAAIDIKVTPLRDIVSVTLPVGEAEKLFETPIHVFTHAASGLKLLRAKESYSVPDDVQASLYTVGDLLLLPRIPLNVPVGDGIGRGNWTNACPTLDGCKGLITPAVIKQRYNVPDTDVGMQATNNSFAVAEFQGQHFDERDLEKFSAACAVDVDVDHVIGVNSSSAGIEAMLDIEYIRGVSDKIDLTFVYAQQYSLLDWATKLNSDASTPWVHSVSYGNDEAQQISTKFMESCNVQFMAAGIRGISILFASGDQGVCGREGCGIGSRKSFKPDFPTGSPYITAVGGTDFNTPNIGEEKAWSDGGGGFSNTFPIPSYQSAAVAAYKASSDADLPPQNLWNNTGRGYPDISALGGTAYPYCIVANGRAEGVAGTSAACPVAASVFARLNGIRLLAGKTVMGFLNPFIYQNADAFQDVTLGSNPGNGGQGFKAIIGWDPATGVGTPDFDALSKLV